MRQYLFWIDRLSAFVGKTFSWLVVLMTFITAYDVTARATFRLFPWCRDDPGSYPFCGATYFAYDAQYILYGTLFMMGGAYTLSRAAHVRGDIFYKDWSIRTQAWIDLILYLVFFFPGVLALISVGLQWGLLSLSFNERSALSSNGPPIWPLKLIIPIAGFFILLQGLVEVTRCIQAIRTGEWPQRLSDVEETETRLARETIV